MKVSRHFRLNRSQHELDFVDIDLDDDTPLFLDPHVLAHRNDRWSQEATRSIRNFFRHFLTLVRGDRKQEALDLFSRLGEPKETRLGLSRVGSDGLSVGPENSREIFDSMSQSRAVQTGLVEDIEDCRLFVPGVDRDKISDMCTNIIRRHLIAYTQQQCRLWGIPLRSGTPTGSMWDRTNRRWEEGHDEMLVVGNRKLLLVPKGVVVFVPNYRADQYYQHFVLNFLQAHHLRINSALVKRRRPKRGRPGERYVTKKSIAETEAPFSKDFLINFSRDHREVLQRFKDTIKANRPIDNNELSSTTLDSIVDRLVEELQAIPMGPENATRYHRTVVAILQLLFHPRLTSPTVEREVDQGRKRIDLVFDNSADHGFFQRLHSVHLTPSQYIKVECKNYSRDLANPELDQMIGRLHVNSGKFGLIVCRRLDNPQLFLERCRDTYQNQQGIILPLVDSDLTTMLQALKENRLLPDEAVLQAKLRDVQLR